MTLFHNACLNFVSRIETALNNKKQPERSGE